MSVAALSLPWTYVASNSNYRCSRLFCVATGNSAGRIEVCVVGN